MKVYLTDRKRVTTIIQETVGKEPEPGEMLDMQLTTPIIEIADDLQTAKCVWWMPGAGAIPQEEGDPMAIWAWGELAVTFIYEADMWKIWKLHYFRYMKCDYKKGWVDDTSMINRLNTPLHPMSGYDDLSQSVFAGQYPCGNSLPAEAL